MRISDWSSDVCSSDLVQGRRRHPRTEIRRHQGDLAMTDVVTLRVAIEAHGEPLSELTLRRPTVQEVRAIKALPYKIDKSERSEERRAGKECVSTCRSSGSPEH